MFFHMFRITRAHMLICGIYALMYTLLVPYSGIYALIYTLLVPYCGIYALIYTLLVPHISSTTLHICKHKVV